MPYVLTRWERLALAVILMVGAWLRFQHLDAIELNIDQAYPIWQAVQTLDEGELPLTGQGTSVLFANPPLTGYLYLPVVALFRDPLAVYVFTLALNTFAIFLVYRALIRLVRRYPITGMYPALFGAALFAVNPWIIEDSRRTWVQSLLPFFMAVIAWALAPILTGQTRHPRRRMIVAGAALAMMAHTYLLAYAMIATVTALLLIAWRWRPDRFHKWHILAGIGFFLVLAIPYGIGLYRDWDRTSERARQFASGEERLSDEALRHAVRLVTGWDYAQVRGVRAPARDADLRDTLSDIAHWLWTLALISGVVQAVRALLKRGDPPPPERDSAVILLIWFLLPVLMFSVVSRPVHPFYLLLTVPAGHGLAAWGVRPTLNRPRLATAVIALVLVTGTINSLNVLRFAEESAALPGADLPGALPLEQGRALGEALHAAGAPDRAVFSPLDDWLVIALVEHDFRVAKTETYGPAVLVPESGAIVMRITRAGETPAEPPPYATLAGEPITWKDGTVITLWQIAPGDVQIDHPAAISSDAGVSFAGWTLHDPLVPGAVGRLDTFWRIDELAPERGIWSFLPVALVMDADGQRVAEAQGNAVSALTWAVGDLWVQPLTLTVPEDAAGPLALRVGLLDPVRLRPDGLPGLNAVFMIPREGQEALFTPEIVLGD